MTGVTKYKRNYVPLFPVASLLLIAAVLPFASGLVPTVRFVSERIDVHVYPDAVAVEGYYLYRNPFPFPVVQGFTIPFPIDSDHPEPSDVVVERLTPRREALGPQCLFGNTAFEMFFPARGESVVRVTYRQKVSAMNATYILRTTRPWGRPLENGTYTLYPHGTAIKTSNYPLDRTAALPGFRRSDFLPDEDWRFTWRRGNEKSI